MNSQVIITRPTSIDEATKHMAFDDQLSVIVACGDEAHIYSGQAFFVAKKIAEQHSYNQFADVDRFEDLDAHIEMAGDMFKEILACNGDGCDFIHMMVTK